MAQGQNHWPMVETATLMSAQDILYKRENMGPTVTSTEYYAAPVSHFDLSNSSNLNIHVGEREVKGCLKNESLSARIKLLKDVFVEVHTLERAKHLLKSYGRVTICGAPGDGKTSIALMLCHAYRSKKYEVLFVERTDDLNIDIITNQKNSRLLIVFDDIFGCVSFSCNLEKLHKLFAVLTDILMNTERKRKDKNKQESTQRKLRVVVTSRTYNLTEGCSHLSLYKHFLFSQETVLDLTKDKLTCGEKTQILSSFRSWRKMCDMSDDDIHRYSHLPNDMFGFPFICKLYFTTPTFQIDSESFFRQPLPYLRGDLDHIVREDSNRAAAVILLVLSGGSLDLVSFQTSIGKDNSAEMFSAVQEIIPSCTKNGIGREINNFLGTYCTVDRNIASFSHPSIYDAAACAFGKMNIILLLNHCSLKFLFERVRLNKSNSSRAPEPDDVTNMIYIDDSLYPLAVNRIVVGIKQRHFSTTLSHPLLKNTYIASSFLAQLKEDLPLLIQEKDHETEKCFLYWSTLSDSETLFQEVLDLVDGMIQNSYGSAEASDYTLGKRTNDLYEALVSCVLNNRLTHLESISKLLQKTNEFDVNFITEESKSLLFIAIERSYLKVFKFLIQNNADPSITGKRKQNCLHAVCDAGNEDMAKILLDVSPSLIDDTDERGRTPALICAELGHLQLLRFLVTNDADLDITDTSASNCLHVACMEGRVAIVKYLLSLKRPSLGVNRRDGLFNQTPLILAAEGGHYEVYKELVAAGADVKLTDYTDKDCLMFACESGSLLMVKHLLSLKLLDINGIGGFSQQTPLMFAAERGHYHIFRTLELNGANMSLTDKYDRDCLLWSCVGGSLSIVKHILSLNTFDINKQSGLYNTTPVSMAAIKGHHDVFHLLVSQGADLLLNDNHNRDCLMLACVGGNIDTVKHLLSLKIFDINRRAGIYKRSPLMVAVEKGHLDIYHLLLEEGADLSLTDEHYRDCLMWACYGGNASIVEHLLSLKRFDINRRGGPDNETPLMMAASRGHSHICSLLVSEGAET